MLQRYGFLISLILFLPKAIQACTVCFGGQDGAMERGFYWGIVVLGALPFVLLAVFISCVAYSIRRKKAQ